MLLVLCDTFVTQGLPSDLASVQPVSCYVLQVLSSGSFTVLQQPCEM